MDTITEPKFAFDVVDYPVPGGLERWHESLERKRGERHSQKRKVSFWNRARRIAARAGPGRMCWGCGYRLIAQGASINQQYARKNKLCIACYTGGARMREG